jgi:hypothetical protein
VAGVNFVILEYTDQICNVSPFAKSFNQKENVPIVKAATAYDDERTGTTYILVLGQALYFGNEEEASLLCPNQLRTNGVIVDDVPIHLLHNTASTHSITFPHENVMLPLKLNGCFSYIPTRTPTTQEIESCQWLILTSDAQWEQSLMPFNAYEEAAINAIECPEQHRNLYAFERSPLKEISEIFDDDYILNTVNVSAVITSPYKPRINASQLAQRWSIGEAAAAKTLRVTTQMGIRNCLYPIERRFRTKQSQLRYPQLSGRHGRFYTDTFFASVPAIDGSKCAQLFANDIGFSKIYPMRLKSEAPNALQCFIHDVGIPQVFHIDNAKELLEGR